MECIVSFAVMTISFLRLHEGVPFCYTRVHVPMRIGRMLRELPEIAALTEPGVRAPITVISLMNRVSEHPSTAPSRMSTPWPRTLTSPTSSGARQACPSCASTGSTVTAN
jgi:hypothetical protein